MYHLTVLGSQYALAWDKANNYSEVVSIIDEAWWLEIIHRKYRDADSLMELVWCRIQDKQKKMSLKKNNYGGVVSFLWVLVWKMGAYSRKWSASHPNLLSFCTLKSLFRWTRQVSGSSMSRFLNDFVKSGWRMKDWIFPRMVKILT